MRYGMTTRPGGWPLAISVLILELMIISAFSPALDQPAIHLKQSQLPAYFLYQYEGDDGTQPNWLSIQLVGGGPINRDANGTKVFLTTNDGHTELQEVKTNEVGSNSKTDGGPLLHFDMGQAMPEQVRVVWPNGHVQIFTDIPVNQIWVVEYDDTNTLSWEQIIGLGALIVAFALIFLMTMWRQSANDISKIFSWRK